MERAGAPESDAELFVRARRLAGRTLGEIATGLGAALPERIGRKKGSVGQLVELALGADAGSRPTPDFTSLGVELKTIPVDRKGRPRESTYVCYASLDEIPHERWETSRVKEKLSRVLLLPIEAEPEIPLEERRVGAALLWVPEGDDEARLRADWEDLADLIAHGFVDAVTARRGDVLQLRPKAAHAGVRTQVSGPDGEGFSTLPRGFYLRRSFIESILKRHFAVG